MNSISTDPNSANMAVHVPPLGIKVNLSHFTNVICKCLCSDASKQIILKQFTPLWHVWAIFFLLVGQRLVPLDFNILHDNVPVDILSSDILANSFIVLD